MTQPPIPPGQNLTLADSRAPCDDTVYDPLAHLKRAIGFLQEIPVTSVDIEHLLVVHRLVMPAGHPQAGKWRDGPVVVWLRGRIHSRRLPDPADARQLAADALSWLAAELASESRTACQAVLASEIARRLVLAHPFADGNGRVARALGSWVLVRSGYKIVADPGAFLHDKGEISYTILEKFDTDDPASPGGAAWHSLFRLAIASCFIAPSVLLSTELPFREAPELQFAASIEALMRSCLTQPARAAGQAPKVIAERCTARSEGRLGPASLGANHDQHLPDVQNPSSERH
jgi:fido (protein-threonine AMPylation protein)